MYRIVLSQPNILIDANGNPRLSNFGLYSIGKYIKPADASAPQQGCSIQYCAPELLDFWNAIKDVKRKLTKKSDVYYLSMVIVEVRMFRGSMEYPGSPFSPPACNREDPVS